MTDQPNIFFYENTAAGQEHTAASLETSADFAPGCDLAEAAVLPETEVPLAESALGGTACEGAEVTIDWSRVDCNGMLHDATTGKFVRRILAHELMARPKPASDQPPAAAATISPTAKSCVPSSRRPKRAPKDMLAWATQTTGTATEFKAQVAAAELASPEVDLANQPTSSTDSLGGLLRTAGASAYSDLLLPDMNSRAARRSSASRRRRTSPRADAS